MQSNFEIIYKVIIQQDIYSFGNSANGKEHWLQIYPPLFHFDDLVVRLKITILSPTQLYIRIHLNRYTDSLMSTSACQFISNKFVCIIDIQSLKSQALSLGYWILDSCNGQVSQMKYITQRPDLVISTSILLYNSYKSGKTI